jgi:hypothetical protein
MTSHTSHLIVLLAVLLLAVPAFTLPILEQTGCQTDPSTTTIVIASTTGVPPNPYKRAVLFDITSVTEVTLVANTFGHLHCGLESVENLEVTDSSLRQIVGPLQVNQSVLISNSGLLLQAEFNVLSGMIIRSSALMVAQNKTIIGGELEISESSVASLQALAQVHSLSLSNDSTLDISITNDDHLPSEPLLEIAGCRIILQGTITISFSDDQISNILNDLSNDVNVSMPLIYAGCVNIPEPPIERVKVVSQHGTQVTTQLLVTTKTVPNPGGGSSTLHVLFSMESGSIGTTPSSPSTTSTTPTPPGSTASGLSTRTKIIIGASIGGAALLLTIASILVYNVAPLRRAILPYRR